MPVPSPADLTDDIVRIGFRCTGCGDCCRRVEPGSNLVMAGAPEIRRILQATGGCWDDVALPYPEYIDGPGRSRITFGWCLRHAGDTCAFLGNGRCRIYAARPWICRTYPFMLGDDGLIVSECPGIGGPIGEAEAYVLAVDLLARKHAEDAEHRQVALRYGSAAVPPGMSVVIDSEGVKHIHG
jgi:Fe-S-cluster containining protein